ncbi:hypothetical protein BJ684DRAFT_20512 [Piptocephalis cylindrospora]|uniref:Uncharacterized protein n=1 Tax=Piptocephalis cylindrospora TaxID=1907219 RepID=A0A4V1IY14_9FUNG|nr:hypothetical protein BJ684DRAFT_20512 [Piptocephalis cylindrospora]|eukprot:RKP12969.1 hypothetical protein BJ684DRAFT_20512 [Piptocephalis cylindrospora]
MSPFMALPSRSSPPSPRKSPSFYRRYTHPTAMRIRRSIRMEGSTSSLSGEEQSPGRIICPGCQHDLGRLQNKDQVMLDKWEITPIIHPPLPHAPWATYAALEILALSRTHASYRFILQPDGRATEPIMGHLWLMHGRTWITGSGLQGQGPHHVLRLLYHSSPDTPEIDWKDGEDGVEVLPWSKAQILQVLEALKHTTALSTLTDQGTPPSPIPGPFPGFTQGFLPL